MEAYSVFVIGGDDDEAVSFATDDEGDDCRLTCVVRGETHIVDAPDFFHALQLIRQRVLEPMGLIPFCYGASLKVWPSGMSRDMGLGLTAYKIETGEQASDLVNIFDEGHDVIPASVRNQEEFAQSWFASLRA
ncbi:hypothetical protein P1X14_10930 [Sphingomonas sp. AOB5]|uniref:hypothetical protein n=1 Tax=Sphingomonas sp. AOB5 TaxID=3034017 RepID=UPI0023F915E9|nr:hypothetical protein [Sphingomonas sp. AOB5]MDF7775761.1 hypothetical protein [Sphingomonas sp. AOB5]